MTLKQQVLKILRNNRDKSISGEQLGKELFCSRNAIWKAIKSLKEDGYRIDAVTNKGYCLIEESNLFSADLVEKYLEKGRVILLDSVDSTNNYLKKLAEQGEAEATVVIAKQQSKGKGRIGRNFFSPENGLYMSILLRPNFSAEHSLFITTAAAVAVSETIEKYSDKKAEIKWVNDVFVENKKVCGILTEASVDFETGGLFYAILGIGVNIYSSKEGFPEELKDIAGTVFESNPENDIKARIAADIVNSFFKIYDDFENSDCMKRYRNKSFILGKKIYVIKNNEKRLATALDIDEKARLIVEYEDKTKDLLNTGEVSIKL